jgi:hypothetical protein
MRGEDVESIRQDVGARPHVRIALVQGDLRVSGRPGTQLEAQAGSRGGLLVQPKGEVVEVSSRSGCLMFLPPDTHLEIGRVSGDVRVAELTGELMVEQVGGDLTLRRVGPASVGEVGGSLTGRHLTQELHGRRVGGDMLLEHVGGEVELETLGGDLRGTRIEAGLRVRLRGDALLEWLPPAGSSSTVDASGDVVVRFLAAASARVSARAGGDLRLLAESGAGEHSVTLGSGGAEVRLSAGGDVLVTRGGAEFTADLAEEISAQVDAALADVEAGLEDVDLKSLGLDAKETREKIHHALTHALRRARSGAPPTEAGTERPGDSGDEERLAILRMLEEGKVTVEQAEGLLRALEEAG